MARETFIMASLEPASEVCLSQYYFAELDYAVWANLSKGERDAHTRLAVAHIPTEMRGNLTRLQDIQRAWALWEHKYLAPELQQGRDLETCRALRAAREHYRSLSPERSTPLALFLTRTIGHICSFIGGDEPLLLLADRSFRQIRWNRAALGYPGFIHHVMDYLAHPAAWRTAVKLTLRRTLKRSLLWSVPCTHDGFLISGGENGLDLQGALSKTIGCVVCRAEVRILKNDKALWSQLMARQRERMCMMREDDIDD